VIIDFFKYIAKLIFIILIQLLVINNIELNTYINPYIYIIFILTLPVTMKPWLVVILSFFVGLLMDTFSSTPGLHMAASGFVGYFRSFYLSFACSKEDFEKQIAPSLAKKGFAWFTFYTLLLTLLHHTVLFYLEIYSLSEFFRTFFRILSSTLFSVLIIVISQLLFYRNKESR